MLLWVRNIYPFTNISDIVICIEFNTTQIFIYILYDRLFNDVFTLYFV